ncbi:MAG: hypothetical protein WCY15_01655 [Phenylobacterium sp.]|jgi:hypothetical protein|uniref:hypothetical protein n=1 Tax=Phenylobacterium sp. TaxID=1871053 RepID=UPI002A2F0863|nr:hypothetical protein [Phenylobacterium sp.]MDD3837949.1 hypothetical protein [Phenylobacterium sp.]MDX9998975.1 hypothetical protein [Phenylobacterium sp.]
MATERVTDRTDGLTSERTVERHDGGGTTYVERGGSGIGGVIIGIAVLALVAIIAFFLLNMNRQEAMETQAITGAANSVAESVGGAADSVGDAAQSAAQSVNPAQ